jgi:hypothetical protein
VFVCDLMPFGVGFFWLKLAFGLWWFESMFVMYF